MRNFFCMLFLVFGFVQLTWAENLDPDRPFRILAIDGGGIRGIIPATIIAEIEKELGSPAHEIFDMIAGSSTGGILALSLSVPDQQGHAKFSAQDILQLYKRLGDDVFSASVWHRIKTAGGLLGPKYDSLGLKKVSRRIFGSTKLSDALTSVLITGYHVHGENGVEFSSDDAQNFPSDRDCPMRQVAMATGAAPTFFDPVDINFSWGTLESVVDGALYRNNPSLLAYANAKRMYPNRKIEIYSLGTGRVSAEELNQQLKGRGILQWLPPIIKHLQIGSGEADITILHKLLNEDGEKNFFRLDLDVIQKFKKMDDTRSKTIRYLEKRGKDSIQTPIFMRMLEKLKR